MRITKIFSYRYENVLTRKTRCTSPVSKYVVCQTVKTKQALYNRQLWKLHPYSSCYMLHGSMYTTSQQPEVRESNTGHDSKSTSISFEQTQTIYRFRSTWHLIRAYGVFRVCQIPGVVQKSDVIIQNADRMVGVNLMNKFLKATFFAHFCGGENADDIRPVIQQLQKAGIGGIINYAAEADIAGSNDTSDSDGQDQQENNYDSTCDTNTALALQSIIDAGTTKQQSASAFAAIKCTALGPPELLMRMTTLLLHMENLFMQFAQPDQENLSYLAPSLDQTIDKETMQHTAKKLGLELTEEAFKDIINCTSNSQSKIDYLDWMNLIDDSTFYIKPLEQLINEPPLNASELKALEKLKARLHRLASCAKDQGVKLLVDAEQTYLQQGIDYLVHKLQQEFNKKNNDVVYNTAQCYLKNSSIRIDNAIARAHRENFHLALKIVRGAYLVQERNRAQSMGYDDPIHSTIENTHKNFNSQFKKLLNATSQPSLVIASHNENSVQEAASILLARSSQVTQNVTFGQLFGMCDYISFTLGSKQLKVVKVIPYGPIREVLPYLIRRAQENAGVMNRSSHELSLLRKELKIRLLPWLR